MIRKILFVSLISLLFIGVASAWTIQDTQNRVSGTVDFYADGSGVLNVTGYPVIDFSWHQNGDGIVASYLFYNVNVYYNSSTDTLYSPDISNVTLKR